MTQDQYGARGDVVPDDQTGDYPDDQAKQKTRFQKVASALLGDKPDRDEENGDEPTANRVSASPEEATGSDVTAQDPGTQAADPPWVTEQDEAAMANSPISQDVQGAAGPASSAGSPAVPPARAGDRSGTAGSGIRSRDYWDETEADGTEAATVTRPDGPASSAAAAQDPVAGATPYSEGQPGAATIADVPAASGAAGTAGRHAAAPAAETPAAGTPAAGTPAAGTPAAGTPAAGTPAASGMRPGEASGALGDFSDLTYGNLVPDAEQYAAQWQQIQFRFVDDPHASVTEAADVVAQVTAKMEAAIQERQRAVEERQHAIAEQQRSLRDRWGEGTNADTEAMRETLRMYKTFLDQLIGPRAS